MNSSLKQLSVVSTLFLFACGGSTDPVDRPDAGAPPADSGQPAHDAGWTPEDGGPGDAGTSTPDGGQTDGGQPDAGTTTTPAKPTLTGTQPATRGFEAHPLALGTAEPGVTVELYDSFLCSGAVLASGTAGEDGTFAIAFPARLNSFTTVTAHARRGTLTSDCSDKWVTYNHDDRKPQVQSVTPTRDATNVLITLAPSVSFSESMAPASVKLDVTCAGQPVEGTLEVSGSRATFTPAATLPEVTTCTVTLHEATDVAGNAIAAPDTWSFTTQRVPNPNPPTFTGTTPTSPGKSTSVSVAGRATASLKVELFTASDCASGALWASGTATTSGTFSLPGTVVPNASTTFWGQAIDSAGRRSTCSPTSLTYVHDGVAPTVASTNPASNATDVDPSALVSVTLSELVKNTSGVLTVKCGGVTVQGSSAASSAVVTFTPSQSLPLDATCTATLATTVTDLAGNALAEAYAWSFTLKPSPPPATPTLTAFSPTSPGKTTTPSVQGTAAAGVSVDLFTTSDCSGTATASGTATTSGTFSIPVTVAANGSTSFWAQARSAVGRRSGCTAQGLTYVHDGVAPTVVSTSPASDAANVETNVTVTATLSEPVKAASGALTVKCDNVTVQGTVSASGAVVTFTPSQALPLDGSCTATLATSVTDVPGNPLASAYSWSFTTKQAPPPSAPTLTGLSPTSPGNSKTPTVSGKSGAGTFVELYSGTDCSGSPLASGTATAQGTFSLAVTVGANTTTLISATARNKPAGARSACTTQVLTYRHDDIAPTVAQVSPANGATNIEPTVQISAELSELVTAPVGTVELKCADIVLPGTLTVSDRTLSFAPSFQPALDASCVVTVKTGVKDQAGNALGANYSWSFTTRAAQWSTGAVVASASTNGSVKSLAVGIDSDGDATLAWANELPYKITRHDLNPQQGATSGTQLNAGSSDMPVVATSPNGHVIVAWRDSGTSPARIFATVFVPGTGWTTPQVVSTAGLSATDPRVAIDNTGQALVVFLQRPTTSTSADSLYARRFLPSTGWQSQTEIDGTSETYVSNQHPSVSTDGKGGFFVVWSGEFNTGFGYNYHLFVNWLRAGSSFWEGAKYFATEKSVRHPQGGCDAQGNCTLVYKVYSSTAGGLIAKALRYESAQWNALVLGPAEATTESVGLSVNAVGQVVVAFSHYSSTLKKYEVMARRYEPGVGWSSPVVAGPSADVGNTGFFDVGIDAQGNAIVLSRRYDASSVTHLFATRYQVGTGWGAPEELDSGVAWSTESSISTGRDLGPRVAMSTSGKALIVYWKGKDVYARWLE